MRIPYKKAIGQDLKPGRPSIGKKPGKPELKKLYIKETRSIREIAENLRCSKDMVYRALQEYGIEIRGKTRDSKLSSIDFALLKKEIKENYSEQV